jgi:hypothetical protein
MKNIEIPLYVQYILEILEHNSSVISHIIYSTPGYQILHLYYFVDKL